MFKMAFIPAALPVIGSPGTRDVMTTSDGRLSLLKSSEFAPPPPLIVSANRSTAIEGKAIAVCATHQVFNATEAIEFN